MIERFRNFMGALGKGNNAFTIDIKGHIFNYAKLFCNDYDVNGFSFQHNI